MPSCGPQNSLKTIVIFGVILLFSNKLLYDDRSDMLKKRNLEKRQSHLEKMIMRDMYDRVDGNYKGDFNIKEVEHNIDPADDKDAKLIHEYGEIETQVVNNNTRKTVEKAIKPNEGNKAIPKVIKPSVGAYSPLKLKKFANDTDFLSKPLLVLFSSWSHSPEKSPVHQVLLRLWNSWSAVRPLCFTNDKKVVSMAKASNWSVLPVTKFDPLCFGPPQMPALFRSAITHHDAYFYGFANSDIMFDDGLVKTMKYIYYYLKFWQSRPVLIIGRRHNVDFTQKSTFPLVSPKNVSTMSKKGSLVQRSTDFYFTNRHFPWGNAPELTVGRPFVVRATLSWAYKNKYIVIDATKTITSVHLTTKDGIKSSFHKKGTFCNKRVLAKWKWSLPTNIGHVECAHFETYFADDNTIRIRHKPSGSVCH